MDKTVFATFSVLKQHIKLKVNQDHVAIDNIVFRLHYRATFLILLTSCLLVTSRQFIGDHIKCITDTAIPENVINTFCFFTSTFTVTRHMNTTLFELGYVAHPGIGPATEEDHKVHHTYYQWVPFVLFFQALLFYIPHNLWKKAEGGRLKQLVSGLHIAALALNETEMKFKDIRIPPKKEIDKKFQSMKQALLDRIHMNRPWVYYLCIFEVLNFINVLAQIYLTDWFLGGTFVDLGQNLNYNTQDNGTVDPLDIVFPKVTKCTFHKYGSTGTIQTHDALCVMALNIVNEKIYTFLWFWFIILAIITGLSLLWRIFTFFMYSRFSAFNRYVFMMASPGRYNPSIVLDIKQRKCYSDWLFLYYIAKNLDNYIFKDLLERLEEDYTEDQAEQKQAIISDPESINETKPLKAA